MKFSIYLNRLVFVMNIHKNLIRTKWKKFFPFGEDPFSEGSLGKHAYSNIMKILPPKNENVQRKMLIFFHISAQNTDCGYSLEPPRRGDSTEYPKSLFLSRNKKIMYTPVNPSLTIKKWGLRGSK